MSIQFSVTITLKDGESIEAATKRLVTNFQAAAAAPTAAKPAKAAKPAPAAAPAPDDLEDLGGGDDDLGEGTEPEEAGDDLNLEEVTQPPPAAAPRRGRPPKAAAAPKTYSYEEVCKAVKDYATTNGRDKAMKVLERFGAPKGLKELKPECYADVMKVVGG